MYFGGLTAYDTRREAYGAGRRTILTHSPELHAAQVRGFEGTTLAKAGRKLDELAATLAGGKTRRARDKVEAEITAITCKPWVRRVVAWQLSGDHPRDLRLTWGVDGAARAALEEEVFGKHVLITSHDDWPVPEVVAGYRSQSEAESASSCASWPASARPSCSTRARRDGPVPTACSPTPVRSKTSSARSSASPATLPGAEVGNTPSPPRYIADQQKHAQDQLIPETPAKRPNCNYNLNWAFAGSSGPLSHPSRSPELPPSRSPELQLQLELGVRW
jgi:hypothetical protein